MIDLLKKQKNHSLRKEGPRRIDFMNIFSIRVPQSNLKVNDNSSISQVNFSSKADPFIFKSIEPELSEWVMPQFVIYI